MNVELVTDGIKPRLLWRGQLADFLTNWQNSVASEQVIRALHDHDEYGFNDHGVQCWLRPDIGEWGPIQPQTEAKS